MKIEFIFDAPYGIILERQLKEFNSRIECRKRGDNLPDDLILIVEHRPVITVGRYGKISNILVSETALNSASIDFFKIERGGDVTYHGPGQLTIYPILDLTRYNLGVKDYVNLLEETVIRTLSHYGIRGERVEGATGVWLGKGTLKERKISAIGIKCSRFVTMHGLALNVGSDLTKFSLINPCGFIEKGVTSISVETGSEIDIKEAGNILASELQYLLQARV